MRKLSLCQKTFALFLLCAAISATTATGLPAQTLTTLHSFDNTDGANPFAGLVQATDGNLYGTTYHGGNGVAGGAGTIFRITPSGTLTTLYEFCAQSGCPDGQWPYAGLMQAGDGNLYGTTYYGGTSEFNADGTAFRITLSGSLTSLHSFDATDGQGPEAGLVQAANGTFFGTTVAGGIHDVGTVFQMTSSGAITTLYTFGSGLAGGSPTAGMIQGSDGNLYGTTEGDGAYNHGTIFKITPSGALKTLYNFCAETDCADGADPYAGLVQGLDGNLYGTTAFDGANGGGTVFKITKSGKMTTLYSFCVQSVCSDGANPFSGLVLASDGNFYGTTQYGGAGPCDDGFYAGCGTIFRITSSGTMTTLYSFCAQTGCTDGQSPFAGLFQATDGNFYGTTQFGGTNNLGTVYRLAAGLGPIVATQPANGKVGARVKILGSNLTGTTRVEFNGVPAVFIVVSNSLITTSVPAGSTSGRLHVETPAGALSNSVPFRVLP
jgi:uncharacterized repeat protein (TIGR03803 family)